MTERKTHFNVSIKVKDEVIERSSSSKSINKEKHLIQNEVLDLESPDEKSNFPLRDKWGSSTEFVLSCIGWSVGFGNVWRFPYLAYKNGGGAFLFPYFILLILIGKPMYFMEVALGQFCSLGPFSVWRCFPLGKGVGVAMIVVSFIQSISYNVLMAYTLFFLAQSFQAVIPWSNCYEWWGADSSCYVRNIHQVKCANMRDTVMLCNVNKTTMMNVSNMINCTNATQTASEQFWERYVLQLSSSIDEIGSIKWDLALSLFIAWLIVFLCLIKGVKSSGKVIYFTATSPYIILISLFIYGATLDGASDGIYFLFVPKWERLTDLKIWLAAAEQLFYSLGLSWGSLIMFGSYNHFHNKIHKQALLVSSLDFITSLLASLVIFCVLGMLAKETGLCIDEVVKAVKTGVGVAMIVVSFIQSISYNVLMAYTLFFLAQSFQAVIPWSNCYEWWGADSSCYVRNIHQVKCANMRDTVMLCNVNKTTMMNVSNMINCTNATQTASEQFWERYVLQLSSSIDEIGSIKWDLALSLFIAWLIVFLCLIKGVKSSGKVIYFTATSPYIILISLFIYGATLDGASDGIYFLFVPKWERLTDLKIWLAAAEQLFYSLGLSWGSLIMFGSYNHFHNKIHKQALLVSSLDFITSLLASLVIFCVLGMLAKETGLCIDEVVKADQGLAFVVYPEALATLWLPQLWTFLFFMMMLLLGIDSEFALLETLTTVIYDEFPKLRKYKIEILLFLCSLCFLLGLPCVTQGGAYIFNIMHTYGAGFPLLFIAICELLSIMWGYGMNRLCCDFEMMLGIKINYYFKANWLVISPVILSIIFIYGISTHERLAYNDQNNPDWAETVGWILALSSMIQIPLWAVITLIKYRNNLHQAIYPTSDWGPEDVVIKNEWLKMVNEMKVKYLHKIVQDTTESQL
ncbi:sodium-dependent proline transporter-like [Centruroides sculpturatus]|uniref:sodium-dependent proline transporter-like n=1 Tax=Centruroides sculpturatus TaxID=218467 RepID=UPI000C6CC8F1|nr:sodium-dependent proline transporter-like [Centruroides sculpturatus]